MRIFLIVSAANATARVRCAEVYSGPTFPDAHGARCNRARDHEGRHENLTANTPRGGLSWWSAREKILFDAIRNNKGLRA